MPEKRVSEIPVGLGDDVSFEVRLGETIVWCLPRGVGSDPQRSLRSEELTPSVLGASRADTLFWVVRRRADHLWSEATPVGTHEGLGGGRLLFYDIDSQVLDGASAAESGGFFDWEDAPPWDTWIALHKDARGEDVLLSWVPPQLLEAAAQGIAVNPVGCIGWLEDSDLPIAEALRSHGLL